MEASTVYIGSLIVLGLGLLALFIKNDIAPLFAFIGGMLGMLFFTSLNSDGVITNAYGFTGASYTNSTTGIWPLGYLFILFLILDFAIGIYITIGKVRF